MNTEDFNSVLYSRLKKTEFVLAKKALEYVRNEDRLHNFHYGASISGQHPGQVLNGFMLKHYISYNDLVNDMSQGKPISREIVDEKIGDLINYLILQECIMVEYINNLKEKANATGKECKDE